MTIRRRGWKRLLQTAIAGSALILTAQAAQAQDGPKITPADSPPASSTEAAPAALPETVALEGPVVDLGHGGCRDGHCPVSAGKPTAGGLDYERGNITSVPSHYGYPQFHYDRYRWNNYARFHKDRVTYHSQPRPQIGFTRYWHAYGYGAGYTGHPQAVKNAGGACW